MANEQRVKQIPEADFGQPEEHIRRICQLINGLVEGQGNNHYVVTLTPNAVVTRIIAHKASKLSAVQLSPMSAAAAMAMSAGAVYATVEQNEITLNHDSDAATDRIFGVVLNG